MIKKYIVEVTDETDKRAFEWFEFHWSPEELVMCKDCEFGHHMLNDNDFCGRPLYVCEELSLGQENEVVHHGDWFCADGHRKEEAE